MKTKLSKKITALSCMVIMLSAITVGCMDNDANNGADDDDDAVTQQGIQPNRQGTRMQQQGQARRQNNGQDRIEVADRAADQIVKVPGVKQANVLVTRRNAYVAAVLDDRKSKMTQKTEDQIAKRVRQVDPGIQNVYVSTNPDFVDRINTYVDDVQQGRPVAGFVEQFNEMIVRLFPNAR